MDPKTGEVAAIDKPTQATEQPKPTEAKMTPQYKAREEIARRVEAQRLEDLKAQKFDILNEDGTITPAEEVKEEPKEEVKEEVKEPEQQEEIKTEEEPKEEVKEPPKEEPQEEMRELVVDGKKILVPLSKILDAGVRTYQKETAADMRLAAAAELERQARERLQQVAPKQEAQTPPSDEDAALAKAIQFGTEEDAKAAIAKLRGRATNPQELRQFVQGSLASDIPQHLAFYEANRWVKGEYKEIFSDPDLTQVFMTKEETARRSGDQRPFMDLYKDIAEGMRTKFNLKATPKEEIPSSENTNRVIRKAQAPKVAAQAAGRQAPPPERKQQTVAEYVQRQRELRGLAPLPRDNQGV